MPATYARVGSILGLGTASQPSFTSHGVVWGKSLGFYEMWVLSLNFAGLLVGKKGTSVGGGKEVADSGKKGRPSPGQKVSGRGQHIGVTSAGYGGSPLIPAEEDPHTSEARLAYR